jgi:hypothetical protein
MESDGGPEVPDMAIPPQEAERALGRVGASRAWLARRIVAPCWYHPAFGLLAGGAIAEAEARSWVLVAWSIAAYTVGCGVLMWLNERRVGVAMRYWDPRTAALFAGHVLTLGLLVAAACWLGLDRGIHGAFLVAGLLAAPLTVACGRGSDAVLRARLRAGP